MELKPYQQQVIKDLSLFLEKIQEVKDVRDAFSNFWKSHPTTPVTPFPGTAIEPYKDNVHRVPHICIKVPTAGGKTFIACNALRSIFDAFDFDKPKVVVWLVPSITILDQTIKNLKDPAHPYRQKINSHFVNKVEVFEKTNLLQGNGFNPTSIKEQLNILVFSFDSLRAKNKEDRKVFQENGNLQSFESILGSNVEITLGVVIKHLNPLVIVDESHNAESELSIDMLKELNPCFILDLTATPRKNSNIISFIDAIELKKENMVKLPVIVYNHRDKTEVINSALQLQKRLELQAKEEEKKGGKYIRPVVLFQVQPKNGAEFSNEDDEKSNVQKLKEKLLELKIPEGQIKIKTANINEIKNEELLSKSSEVRYIITINALKEGWDCSFAYILASLADRSSAVDVEQILGRILRQPYVQKHEFPLLNLSYVLTASAKFLGTLDNIVKGLNRAGFSDRDYKVAELEEREKNNQDSLPDQLDVFDVREEDITYGIDVSKIEVPNEFTSLTAAIAQIEATAMLETNEFEKTVARIVADENISLPIELQQLMKTYSIKELFGPQAKNIALTQFYIKIPGNDLFTTGVNEILLEKEDLLEGFALSKSDTNVAFDSIASDLYKVDLDETKKEHTPTFVRLDGEIKERILSYILDPSRKGSRVKNFTRRIMDLMGRLDPISDKEIEKYINRILEDFTDEQFTDYVNNEYTYTDRIKAKIRELSEHYAERKFKEWLEIDKAFLRSSYNFPNVVSLGETAKDMVKTLYEKEAKLNGFEEKIINEIAHLNNIIFWTKNIERRGFRINGFINHYPDFIILTKGGKILVIETKGDHLDAEQKIRLGNLWASKSGNNYRYFMVYDRRIVDGAYKFEDCLNIIKEL